jgi:peptidoglycan hydrolase FlgJ
MLQPLSRPATPMAFNPRSDVVLEVLNAADPSRASLAADRLAALGGAGAPAPDFAADLDKAAAAKAASPLPIAGMADARARLAQMSEPPDKAAGAKVDFEAMMLNSFIGELLPKDASDVFGQGAAGDAWRSMLTEQISRQIAKSGALGLSRRLFATHEGASREVPTRVAQTNDAAQMSANVLSAPSAAEVNGGAVLFAGRKRS